MLSFWMATKRMSILNSSQINETILFAEEYKIKAIPVLKV